jgi:hypothetical protein
MTPRAQEFQRRFGDTYLSREACEWIVAENLSPNEIRDILGVVFDDAYSYAEAITLNTVAMEGL